MDELTKLPYPLPPLHQLSDKELGTVIDRYQRFLQVLYEIAGERGSLLNSLREERKRRASKGVEGALKAIVDLNTKPPST